MISLSAASLRSALAGVYGGLGAKGLYIGVLALTDLFSQRTSRTAKANQLIKGRSILTIRCRAVREAAYWLEAENQLVLHAARMSPACPIWTIRIRTPSMSIVCRDESSPPAPIRHQ